MIFLDTSALVKLYVEEPESLKLEAFVTGQSEPIPFSALHELELSSAFERRMASRDMTRAMRNRVLSNIESDLGSGALVRMEINWSSVLADAIQLVRKHGAPRGLRTLDAMHLGCARTLGADVFVTYDKCQAAAAKAEALHLAMPA